LTSRFSSVVYECAARTAERQPDGETERGETERETERERERERVSEREGDSVIESETCTYSPAALC